MSFQRAFLSGDETLPQVAEEINHHVVSRVFEILHRRKPNKFGSVVARSVSILPVPIIGLNPLSAFREIRDGLREAAEYRLYGWLYFLAELAEAASRPKDQRDS